MAKKPVQSDVPMKACARIAEIIEAVDTRCSAADGPTTPTLKEMTQKELSQIYAHACAGRTVPDMGVLPYIQAEKMPLLDGEKDQMYKLTLMGFSPNRCPPGTTHVPQVSISPVFSWQVDFLVRCLAVQVQEVKVA